MFDVRGKRCPQTALAVSKELKKLSPGEILEVLTDDPLASIDLGVLAFHLGCEVISERQDEYKIINIIKR